MGNNLKVALIDDDPNIISLYGNFIKNSEDMELIAGVSAVENFLKHIKTFRGLDILLLDIDLPGMSGLTAVRKLKAKLPETAIVMFTTFSDKESIFQALRGGASGYLLKDCSRREFLKALADVKEGGTTLSPPIAKKVIEYFNPPKTLFSTKKLKVNITETEKITLHHLVKGLTYQEVADQMDISINSVRHHVRNIYKKLHVNSRTKLIEKYKTFFFG